MKKPIIILGILIGIIAVLFVARTAVSNYISTSGVELGATQEQVATLRTQNAILREKVLSQSALSSISKVAAKKGFVEGKTTFAISNTQPLARR